MTEMFSEAETKLMNAMHYVISEYDRAALDLGAVKLCKTIFFAELAYLDQYGELLTGARIVKAPCGPVPEKHAVLLKELEAAGKIAISSAGTQTMCRSLAPPPTCPPSPERPWTC
jgi:hypothetical protein